MRSIKEYIISEVWNNKYEKSDYNWVNKDEDGKQCYLIQIWSGKGYILSPFVVFADDEESALERTVAYCEKNDFPDLIQDEDVESYKKELESEGKSEEEIEDEISKTYLYVDPTMEGGDEPHYLYIENLHLKKINDIQLSKMRMNDNLYHNK